MSQPEIPDTSGWFTAGLMGTALGLLLVAASGRQVAFWFLAVLEARR